MNFDTIIQNNMRKCKENVVSKKNSRERMFVIFFNYNENESYANKMIIVNTA